MTDLLLLSLGKLRVIKRPLLFRAPVRDLLAGHPHQFVDVIGLTCGITDQIPRAAVIGPIFIKCRPHIPALTQVVTGLDLLGIRAALQVLGKRKLTLPQLLLSRIPATKPRFPRSVRTSLTGGIGRIELLNSLQVMPVPLRPGQIKKMFRLERNPLEGLGGRTPQNTNPDGKE